MDLDVLTASAFLDVHGRYAKREEDVVTVRLFFGAEEQDLTVEEFDALTIEEHELIRNTGSGAPFIVTEGKSNA